jgi:hypothetical protein
VAEVLYLQWEVAVMAAADPQWVVAEIAEETMAAVM